MAEGFNAQQTTSMHSRKLYCTAGSFIAQQKVLLHSKKVSPAAETGEKSVLRQKLEKSSFCGRNWKKNNLAAEIGGNSVRGRNWRKVPSTVETEDRHHVLPAVSVPLANETQFAHKPDQVELQLDRSQLPCSEILWPIIAGVSPAHYCRRQPNPTKKGPYNKILCKRGKGKNFGPSKKVDQVHFAMQLFSQFI